MDTATEFFATTSSVALPMRDRHPAVRYRDIGPLLESLPSKRGLRSSRGQLGGADYAKRRRMLAFSRFSYAIAVRWIRVARRELIGQCEIRCAVIVDGLGAAHRVDCGETEIGLRRLQVPTCSKVRESIEWPKRKRTKSRCTADSARIEAKDVALTHSNISLRRAMDKYH